jgi:predicted transcriptional regulator
MEDTNNSIAIVSTQSPIATLKAINSFLKIKEFETVGSILIPICNKHAVLSGIDKQIDMFTKEEIAKYTAQHLKNLTFEEIELAFQNERFSLYPTKSKHYNFFSIEYYVEIMGKYKVWKAEEITRHNITFQSHNILPEKSQQTIQSERLEVRKQFVTNIYNELKANPQLELVSDAYTLYDELIEKSLINPSNQEKNFIYKKIQASEKSESAKQLSKTFDPTKKNKLANFIQNISTNKSTIVINRCKSYFVCQYIKSFSDLEPLLNNITALNMI